MGLTNTIEDILKSEKSDNCSNITISDSVKHKLLGSIKYEKHSDKGKRILKLKDTIRSTKHKAFVKCVEWARTCEPVELLEKGVM